MTSAPAIEVKATGDGHRALLGVSEAIVFLPHRPAHVVVEALAGQLHQVVQFDGLALVLHEAARNVMHLHMLNVTLQCSSSHVIFRLKKTHQVSYGRGSSHSLRQRLTIYAAGPDSPNGCSSLKSKASVGFR